MQVLVTPWPSVNKQLVTLALAAHRAKGHVADLVDQLDRNAPLRRAREAIKRIRIRTKRRLKRAAGAIGTAASIRIATWRRRCAR